MSEGCLCYHMYTCPMHTGLSDAEGFRNIGRLQYHILQAQLRTCTLCQYLACDIIYMKARPAGLLYPYVHDNSPLHILL